MMQKVASGLNKAKREPFLDVVVVDLDWITEVLQQVTTYRKIFSGGYRRLAPGRTIVLPANHAITRLQSGSFREARFQNGERPKSRVHFYGSMGNVC
jgi:hypothetical protein